MVSVSALIKWLLCRSYALVCFVFCCLYVFVSYVRLLVVTLQLAFGMLNKGVNKQKNEFNRIIIIIIIIIIIVKFPYVSHKASFS
jgi:ammonia channel protein AmtB